MVPGSGAQSGSMGYDTQQPYSVPQDYSVQVNTGDSDQTYATSRPQVTPARPVQVRSGQDSNRTLKPQRAVAGAMQSNVQIGRMIPESGRAAPDTLIRPLSSGVLGTSLW